MPPSRPGRPPRRLLAIAGVAVVALVGVIAVLLLRGDDADGQTADMNAQGDPDRSYATDAATLDRRADGLTVAIEIPTPEPGSYEYPTGDMIPPWAEPHPTVSPGSTGAPEVFTTWVFVFNHPDRCTESLCDSDDLGADTSALGGSYQLDGRIADGDTLAMSGTIRVGQPSMNGAVLENPLGAEVHVAIAPHGRALSGADGWRQLNGPVGNPTLWWASSFRP